MTQRFLAALCARFQFECSFQLFVSSREGFFQRAV